MDWKKRFQSLNPLQQAQTSPDLQLCHLESWQVITATGPDSKSYLQGQITGNIVSLSEQDVIFSGHCDPKGKVWSIFRLFHHNNGYGMLQPAAVVETELKELKKYAVFSKIDLKTSADIILAIMGSKANDYISRLSEDTGRVRRINGGTAIQVEHNRWAIVVEESQASELIEQFTGELVHENVWLYAEIQAGIPVLNAEEQNAHIPQAFNLQAIDGISFTKGCYTGQETVARAKYRGINKRALYTLQGPLKEISNRIEIERSVGENWRSVGHLLAVCPLDNEQAIGQIVLPNNLEEDTQFRIKGSEEQWTHIPLPYSLEDSE